MSFLLLRLATSSEIGDTSMLDDTIPDGKCTLYFSFSFVLYDQILQGHFSDNPLMRGDFINFSFHYLQVFVKNGPQNWTVHTQINSPYRQFHDICTFRARVTAFWICSDKVQSNARKPALNMQTSWNCRCRLFSDLSMKISILRSIFAKYEMENRECKVVYAAFRINDFHRLQVTWPRDGHFCRLINTFL